MQITICDMCGKVLTIQHGSQLYTKQKVVEAIDLLEIKLKAKGIIKPKDLDEIAKLMFKSNESNLTIERIVALRNLDVCAKCEESILTYYDKMEDAEGVK